MPGRLRRLFGQVSARLALATAPTHGLQGEIHERSLSFKTWQVESGFMDGHRYQLENCVFWGAMLIGFTGIFYTVVWHRYWDIDQYHTRELITVSRAQCAIQAGCICASLFGLIFFLILSRWRAIGVYGLELGTVWSLSILQVHFWAGLKHYSARLCGFSDTSELWGLELQGTDSGVLMWSSASLAAMFVMAPIRWKILVPFGALSVLNYAVAAFLVGSPDMRLAPSNILSFIALVLMHCYGKRHDELKERELHWRLLREKTLRCQAEFALCQRDAPLRSSRPEDAAACGDDRASCTTSGLPSTTGTGRIFERAFRKKGAVALEGLMDLGRKEQWLIEADEVRLLPDKQLGSGGFGVVTEGIYHGVAVAVKRPKPDVYGTVRSVTIRELCNELRILRRLRHPNIVYLYGAVLKLEGELELSLVLELIKGAALSRFLCQASCVEDSLRVQLMLNVSCALCYLHSRQPVIVHGDLKADNIFVERMVDGAHSAKLLDFGLSRMITRKASPMGGTLRWMAPELFDGERAPHREADIFSLGRVIFFGVTGLLPFHDKRGESLDMAVREAARLSWPQAQQESSLGRSCERLVEQCTLPEPGARPCADEAHLKLADIATPYLGVGSGHCHSATKRAPGPAVPEGRGTDGRIPYPNEIASGRLVCL